MAINQFNQPYQAPQLIYSQPQQNVPNVPGYLVQPQMVQPIPQPQTNMIFVKGEQGAKSYFVQPNTTVTLWDENDNTIYLKSADGSGMPSIKILDFTFRENTSTQPSIDISNKEYVTKDLFDSLINRINELESKLDSFKQRNYNNRKGGD